LGGGWSARDPNFLSFRRAVRVDFVFKLAISIAVAREMGIDAFDFLLDPFWESLPSLRLSKEAKPIEKGITMWIIVTACVQEIKSDLIQESKNVCQV
jgi:hypothetical protein